jgi:hypothetical protein
MCDNSPLPCSGLVLYSNSARYTGWLGVVSCGSCRPPAERSRGRGGPHFFPPSFSPAGSSARLSSMRLVAMGRPFLPSPTAPIGNPSRLGLGPGSARRRRTGSVVRRGVALSGGAWRVTWWRGRGVADRSAGLGLRTGPGFRPDRGAEQAPERTSRRGRLRAGGSRIRSGSVLRNPPPEPSPKPLSAQVGGATRLLH